MIKVFLVEDEIIIRNGIKNSINWEMHGYDFVGEASDGELALPMILEKKPDILITDIKMPFMDGLELSEQVKKALPATKIMILSGYNEFDYAKMAIKIGVTDYLLKPISSEKLLDAVNKVAEEIRKEQSEKEQMNQYAREMQENKESEKFNRVKLDTENYRERRKATLENLARNISLKVKRIKKPVALEPMNPYERRIIHSALQNDKFCTTKSEGDEPYRHVVVMLKKDAR